MRNTKVNMLFGAIAAVLTVTALTTMYLNQDAPVIREAAKAPGGGGLPQDHPPIDPAQMQAAERLPEAERLSRENPQSAEYKTKLGNVYYDLGQYEKAIEAYRQSLQLHPQDASVETDMATALHYLGRHDEALAAFDRVLNYQPNFPQALYNKGVVLQTAKNDVRGALSAWETLAAVNPEFAKRADLQQKIQQLRSSATP
jgi:tetratricopeptide (TPR) repeat protein